MGRLSGTECTYLPTWAGAGPRSARGEGPGACGRDGQTGCEESCRGGGHGESAKVEEGKGRV